MTFRELADAAMTACRDAFGEDVTYTPSGGAATAITGIFDTRSVVVEAGVPVISPDPVLGIRKADLGDSFEPSRADTVQVRGVTYSVIDWTEDGESGLQINLKRSV